MALGPDSVSVSLVLSFLGIVAIGIILRILRQPHVITYILAGIVLGPFSLGLVKDAEVISRMGEIGIILLLFFAGTEISLKTLASNWRMSFFGTGLQVVASVVIAGIIGLFLSWSFPKIVLFGFIISLSSTAVVLRLLTEWDELHTKVGSTVVGVLLVQDILIVPMLIIIGLFSGKVELGRIGLQIVGTVVVAAFVYWLLRTKKVNFPLHDLFRNDDELQVFLAILLCLGFSQITAFFGLSSALGAFLAGLLISSAEETRLVHKIMHSFRVVFVAVFFVSVGFMINLSYVASRVGEILAVVLAVFFLNTLINSGVLLYLGNCLKESVYAGALLSQIGEFSFLLAGIGLSIGILDSDGSNFVVSVIALTLLLTPFFIFFVKKALGITHQKYNFEASHPEAHRGRES